MASLWKTCNPIIVTLFIIQDFMAITITGVMDMDIEIRFLPLSFVHFPWSIFRGRKMKKYQLLTALFALILLTFLSQAQGQNQMYYPQEQYSMDYPHGQYPMDYPQGYYPTYYPSSYWGYSPTHYSINYPYYYSYINPSFYPTYLPYRYYNYPYYYGYGFHFPSGVLGQELAWRMEAYRFLNSP